MLKIGDKVKFLNEEGGGVVSRIVNSTTVNVLIEDGFEIPALIKDLIKTGLTENSTTSEKMFDRNYEVDNELIERRKSESIKIDARISAIMTNSTLKGSFVKGVYLLFVPQDQKILIASNIDLYLVNYTDYTILYNLFQKNENEYYSVEFGNLAASSKILLDTVEREKLSLWSEGITQIMFNSENERKVLFPVNSVFKMKLTKFMKDTSYVNTAFNSEKSIFVNLCSISEIGFSGDATINTSEKIISKEVNAGQSNTFINRHKTAEKIAEVDLHIGELVDDFSSRSNIEMLNIQLSYFNKCLESSLVNNYTKIIFIHGVGNGILKSEIRKTLNAYEFIEYFDAPINKYGVGATEIKIHQNLKI